MTTTTPAAERTELAAEHLQPILADLLALRLQAKHAHWNVRGAHFRDVHLELDETTQELDVFVDDTAERIVALGVPARGQAAAIAGDAQVAPLPEGFVGDLDALALLADAIGGAVERARGRLDALESDLVTQDLVIGVVQGLEKRRWMLRSRVL